ncbi:hypothetical protein C8F01DRAFT_1259642 [Mycena amicta]|nr:hypothetical protein C8F01DRAFT_1259642 [Mycena amicta]
MAPPRRAYDKTSYAIAPTPASPSRITSPSPSLSPSNSNSASSSTEPTTPPSRPRKNYPDAIGRVPLHRRGTSKTYERLEDLLREAGYKETRIFTPETDRAATQPDGAKSPTISAQVVGFLSHLVPKVYACLFSTPFTFSESHPAAAGFACHTELDIPACWAAGQQRK